MPSIRTFITFGIQGMRYGLDALSVREVVPRPLLTYVAGAPTSCVGLLDLRGSAIPVWDVSVLLGGREQKPRATDHIVIVEQEGHRVGLLVGAIYDVRALADSALQTTPSGAPALSVLSSSPGTPVPGPVSTQTSPVPIAPVQTPFLEERHEEDILCGVARFDSELVLIVNLAALLSPANLRAHGQERKSDLTPESDPSYPSLESQELDLLRARTMTLRQSSIAAMGEAPHSGGEAGAAEEVAAEEGVGVAIVTLGGETFGLALDSVREFCRVGNVTPVPCCPPHVLGQMNLRGDLLTLLDLRAPLGLDASALVRSGGDATKHNGAPMAVVAEVNGARVGIVVEEVREVTHLRQVPALREVSPVREVLPAQGEGHHASSRLPWGGTLPWGTTALNLLDLSQFLARPELVVHEEV